MPKGSPVWQPGSWGRGGGGGQRLPCCATCCSSIPVCAHAASLTSLYSVFLVLLTVLWKAHVFLMPPGTRVYLSGGRICGAVAEVHQTPEAGRLAAFNRMVPGASSSQGPQLTPALPPAMRGGGDSPGWHHSRPAAQSETQECPSMCPPPPFLGSDSTSSVSFSPVASCQLYDFRLAISPR